VCASLCKSVLFNECHERFVVILLHNTLIVNVYFPTVNNDSDQEVLSDIIDELIAVMDLAVKSAPSTDIRVLVGGDFNFVFGGGGCRASFALNVFMSRWSLTFTNNSLPSNLNYSYCHETLQHYSLIDYFLMSKSIISDLHEYLVIDDALNGSDHLPSLR